MENDPSVRVATPQDASVMAHLLHDFNVEFDTPSPGAAVLAGQDRPDRDQRRRE